MIIEDKEREELFRRTQAEIGGKLIPIDRNAPPEVNDEARLALFKAVSNWPQNRNVAKQVEKFARRLNKAKTKDFFLEILNDQTESVLWMFFMTGCFPVVDGEGNVELRTAEIDPIQFAAFKQAVAYKRGQPMTGEKKEEEEVRIAERTLVAVPVDYKGASVEFFLDQGKASGLIK
jgi:hypothetical protein